MSRRAELEYRRWQLGLSHRALWAAYAAQGGVVPYLKMVMFLHGRCEIPEPQVELVSRVLASILIRVDLSDRSMPARERAAINLVAVSDGSEVHVGGHHPTPEAS